LRILGIKKVANDPSIGIHHLPTSDNSPTPTSSKTEVSALEQNSHHSHDLLFQRILRASSFAAMPEFKSTT
jgi:hypothetical protein